jgi:hypothetical protein
MDHDGVHAVQQALLLRSSRICHMIAVTTPTDSSREQALP